MPLSKRYISLGDLYVAYRKAKVEAFYEKSHVRALAFIEYEQDLSANLAELHRRLLDQSSSWSTDLLFIGSYAYLPKSIDCSRWDDGDGHFRAVNPLQDFLRQFKKSKKRAPARLRLIIRPTVDFHIVSALWVLKVGYLFDGKINPTLSFGNRLRRQHNSRGQSETVESDINLTALGLFVPYFADYRRWRENGLSAIEDALTSQKNILAITMDIEQFYHRVSPKFLLRRRFLSSIGLKLSEQDTYFTKLLLTAIETWYQSTPDYVDRPEGAVPVGLSASKIIANVLLSEFDNAISKKLRPIYYGCYVDDIFLAFENRNELSGAKAVSKWLAEKLPDKLRVTRDAKGASSLTLTVPYATDSELIFAGAKQKIFALSSEHGLDLIQHIRNQIRVQSSEYRLLPEVPSTSAEMASRALLATPDAKLEVDTLRHADVVSVRRLGLALLLGDMEVYSSDLKPASWRQTRIQFYGLVKRYALTPLGFFEFSGYLARAFGLMLACADFEMAKQFVEDVAHVFRLLERTSSLGTANQITKFRLCVSYYAEALKEVGLQAATLRTRNFSRRFLSVLKRLSLLNPKIDIPPTAGRLEELVHEGLLADRGRRPYKEFWYTSQSSDERGPAVPKLIDVRRRLRLGGIRRFRRLHPGLKLPHWPALAFPTRPLRADEISLAAPEVCQDAELFRNLIMILRGARVPSILHREIRSSAAPRDGITEFTVPGLKRNKLCLALASYETTEDQWLAAVQGRQDKSWERYNRVNRLVNRMLEEATRPDYIVFPELSIPLKWALRISRKLAQNNVSLLAGVEYYRDKPSKALRNDCFVSLVTDWPGYRSHVLRLQPKLAPAHGEKKKLLNLKERLYAPTDLLARPTLYVHKGYCFSILICSDLTNISHRNALRGQIDTLFVLEWNPDVTTFSSLVEATSSDLHTFVAQVNNRLYGDSRVRAPAAKDYKRDIIRVKGGDCDFYVLGAVDHLALRREQRGSVGNREFKPMPIGFKMSSLRRRGK